MYQFYNLNRAMSSTRLVGEGNGYGEREKEDAKEKNKNGNSGSRSTICEVRGEIFEV